jgi:hypothetical protein
MKKKIREMGEKVSKMLTANTIIGLNFGQLVSIVVVVATMVGFYYNIKTDIVKINQKYQELEMRMTKNENNMEVIRTENRDDHKEISEKMDKILFELKVK